jgi:hypothetical protein
VRNGSLFVDIIGVAEEDRCALERVLFRVAATVGLSDWVLGPYVLAGFDPPKCFGRISHDSGARDGPTILCLARDAAVQMLRDLGYVVTTEAPTESVDHDEFVEHRRAALGE